MTGFENFSIAHWVMLALFVAGIWPVVRLGRSHRGTPAARTFSRWFALAIPAFTVPMQVIDFLPGQYDFDTTLPLQLCDFAWIAAVVALWTHSRFAAALTYYWGLVLTSQALITPWLNADVPSPKFFGYWGMHWLIVWSGDLPGLGPEAHARGGATTAGTVATTAAWAVVVYVFDVLTDTNYGFLVEKPSSGTILDLFGPWPVYVIVEIALIAGRVGADDLALDPAASTAERCRPHLLAQPLRASGVAAVLGDPVVDLLPLRMAHEPDHVAGLRLRRPARRGSPPRCRTPARRSRPRARLRRASVPRAPRWSGRGGTASCGRSRSRRCRGRRSRRAARSGRRCGPRPRRGRGAAGSRAGGRRS